MSEEFEPPKEFDDYSIVQELGRGEMGRVYLAEDAVLARPVAIKFIGGLEPDLEARQRFIMEARAAARIQHPNVVGIYRVGELGERPYIVSELIRGKSLRDLPKPLPYREVVSLGIELARGLAAAHRRGVVHSDVKPENAMLTDEGVPKLVDFGLARFVHEGDSDTDGDDRMVGTPDYMAPEVWAGRAPSRRSDVYSFGAMLFELASGTTAFADVDVQQLGRAVRDRVAPALQDRVPGIDVRLSRLVARCLERDPEARFASGEELREALEQLHPSRTGAVKSDENPYRGLRPFEASHRGLFFGRGLEIGEVVERLRTDAVVIVTGDSGVGKSSLLRAGVIPAIVDEGLGGLAARGQPGQVWKTITMIPGRKPLLALATALGDPSLAGKLAADPGNIPRELQRRAGDRSLLLFVDQMEELITVADPEEVAAFDVGLARISEGVPGVRLVTTVRADFLSKLAALPRLGREISRLLYFLSPLPPERLRDVITGPATATAVTFEDESMISELVEATAHAGSGGLPLLSFALAELWEARDRDRNVITRSSLDRMGGVAGALARHADSVLGKMTSTERNHARRILLRLVTSLGTRVRRTEAELSIGEGTKPALDALVGGRLLAVHEAESSLASATRTSVIKIDTSTLDRASSTERAGTRPSQPKLAVPASTTYELAHEVLVHGWGTLRSWLDDDAEGRLRRERVGIAAAEWQRAGRPGELVLRGPQLVEARSLDVADLTPLERELVDASLRAAVRRKWFVRAGAVAGVLAIATVIVVQRYVSQQRIDAAVGKELAAARHLFDRAMRAEHDADELAKTAFAKFDAGDASAEDSWSQVTSKRAAAERDFRFAGSRVEAALAKDPARADVRDFLGDILLERAMYADAAGHHERTEELLARLPAYDADGSRWKQWDAPGSLDVSAPGATLEVQPADGKASDAMPVKGSGRIATQLARGSYVVVASAPGRETVRAPVLVERARKSELVLRLPRAGAIPAGFVYVPRVPYLYGSAADEDIRTSFFQAQPLHRREGGNFFIGRTEVTIGEWMEFVETVPPEQQTALLPQTAQLLGALVIDKPDGRGWRITMQPVDERYTARWGEPLVYRKRTRRASQDWRKFPITGISPTEIVQYVAWLDRTGKVPHARLCTETEWEQAARGADGRTYPHGKPLEPDDANHDLTYGRDAVGMDEVGSHPASTSPYGLVDTSGNAFEWTRATHGEGYVVRSGSYYHDRKTANLTNRSAMSPSFKDITLGVRLCASVGDDLFAETSHPIPDR